VAHAYVRITVGSSTPAQHHRPFERTRKVSFHHLKARSTTLPLNFFPLFSSPTDASATLISHTAALSPFFTPFLRLLLCLPNFSSTSLARPASPAAKCMPSPSPAPHSYPRPTRNERIARRAAREGSSRDSPRSADNSAFLQLASLQFEALARTNRRRSRSASPRRPRSRSFSPPRRRSRSPITERRAPQIRREPTVSYTSNDPYYTSNDASATARERSSYNPFTITGRDPSPHQEVGSTARPSPEAEESVIGWSEFSRGRQSDNNTRRTDSYRPAYGSTSRGGRYRGRGRATGRRPRGDRGPARSLFDRITPRE
jgi:hypothetical protein